jgi:hypothetical protein
MSIKKTISKILKNYINSANNFGESIIQLYTYPINQKDNSDKL